MSDEKEIVAIEKSEVLVIDRQRTDLLHYVEPAIMQVESTVSEIVCTHEENVVVVLEESRDVLIIGSDQGPQGPQGAAGQSGVSYFTFTAQGPIGGHRAVVSVAPDEVGYADNTNPAHANAVLGITLGAADDGTEIQVQGSGEITEPSWNWTLQQPVFLSTTGQLTQTCPTTGFVLILGTPTAPTKLMVDIKIPFVMEA